MNYAVEMSPYAIICTLSFIQTGLGIQNLIGGYTEAEAVC
jgi:hypothetical protein